MNNDPDLDPKDEPQSLEVEPSGFGKFWAELKRRKVMRVAITYAVVAWLIIQIAAATFPGFDIPPWAFRFVVLMLALGFPVALVITWAFELTPDGIKTTRQAREVRGNEPVSKQQQSKRNWMTLLFAAGLPTVIFGALAVFFYLRSGTSDPSPLVSSPTPPQVADLENSIAVLPLVNMSGIEENTYFAGGVHEDILTNLTMLDNIEVVSRTTMLRYATSELTLQKIGQALEVKYIVEGSVRRIGNHVRVTIQLIDALNDRHMWASNFERELVDVFATQSELAREISNSIQLEIQPESVGTLEGMPTSSVKAYDLYTRAANLEKTEGETEESMIRRRAMLEEVVEIDPDFVEAWAVLKRVYDLMVSRIGQRGWYVKEGQDTAKVVEDLRAKSKRALDKAIALDPDNVETVLSRAVDHIWPQTEEVQQERKAIFDGILATHPEHAMSWYHLGWWYWNVRQDQEAEALAAFDEALKHDPFNARFVRALLTRYRLIGDQENVTRMVERLTQIVPETAEDRSLARVSGSYTLALFRERFLETADEAIITEMERSLKEGNLGKADVAVYNDLSEIQVSLLTNDGERIVALSRQSVELGVSEHNTVGFLRLKIPGLAVLLNRGQLIEAQVLARQILDVEDLARKQLLADDGVFRTALGYAHVALGNVDKARPLAEKLIEEGSTWGPYVMSHVDKERVVDFAFAELAKNPEWNGFDNFAAYQVYCRPFLTHPTVQEHYLQEGKWIDYLSTRVPEYAQYKNP